MRKESRVMKQCGLMFKGLNVDRNSVLHKTKLLLKIYRPVVWSTSNRVFEVLAVDHIMKGVLVITPICLKMVL